MIGLTRLLFLSTVFLVVPTLVLEAPPFRIYLMDIAFVPLLAAWVTVRLIEPKFVNFTWTAGDSAMAALFLAITIAFLFSDDISRSVVEFMDWCRIIVLYFIARSLYPRALPNESVMQFFFFTAIVLLLVGVIQIGTGTSFGLVGNYFGSNLDQSIAANVEGYQAKTRISGTTTNPIVYGIWLAIFSLIPLSALIMRQRYLIFYIASGVTLLAVVSTLSRGAIAAFVLSWVLLIYYHRRAVFQAAVLITATGFAILVIPAVYLFAARLEVEDTLSVLEGRFTQQDLLEEDSGRMRALEMGIDLLADPKILFIGTGPGNFFAAHKAYSTGMVRDAPSQDIYERTGIHNMWMKTWVEYGLFALIFLICVWIVAVRRALLMLREQSTQLFARSMATASLAFFIPFLAIDSQVYESAVSYHILVPLFVLVGILISGTEHSGKSSQRVIRRRS